MLLVVSIKQRYPGHARQAGHVAAQCRGGAQVGRYVIVVDEEGRQFYAVSTEFDPSKAIPWVRTNVLDKLPSPADRAWKSRVRIREELLEFLTEPDEKIELWAWYAAYDHVALCQLWGAMPALPRALPRFTKDLRQRWDDLGNPTLPAAGDGVHDALVDARHNLARWRTMEKTPRW